MTEIDRDDPEFRMPSDYCEHGTYVGGWAGPDYLCHYCEMGYTPEEVKWERFERSQARRKERRRDIHLIRALIIDVGDTKGRGFCWKATWICELLDRHAERAAARNQFVLDRMAEVAA
ncbi:MAG: hypothetical protein E6R03_12665 [Hyphomicrobiaceae bacterium]|nr:MAG: hypothetical protein E6R03_12665 [Hyphomicrobiaceae bacterium]